MILHKTQLPSETTYAGAAAAREAPQSVAGL